MSLQLTLVIAVALLTIALFSGWRGARPPNPARGPRMMPWRFIMMMSAAGLLLALVHLVNMAGLTTGRAP